MSEKKNWTQPEAYSDAKVSAVDRYIGKISEVKEHLRELLYIKEQVLKDFVEKRLSPDEYNRLYEEIKQHALVIISDYAARETDPRNLSIEVGIIEAWFGRNNEVTKAASEILYGRIDRLKSGDV